MVDLDDGHRHAEQERGLGRHGYTVGGAGLHEPTSEAGPPRRERRWQGRPATPGTRRDDFGDCTPRSSPRLRLRPGHECAAGEHLDDTSAGPSSMTGIRCGSAGDPSRLVLGRARRRFLKGTRQSPLSDGAAAGMPSPNAVNSSRGGQRGIEHHVHSWNGHGPVQNRGGRDRREVCRGRRRDGRIPRGRSAVPAPADVAGEGMGTPATTATAGSVMRWSSTSIVADRAARMRPAGRSVVLRRASTVTGMRWMMPVISPFSVSLAVRSAACAASLSGGPARA